MNFKVTRLRMDHTATRFITFRGDNGDELVLTTKEPPEVKEGDIVSIQIIVPKETKDAGSPGTAKE